MNKRATPGTIALAGALLTLLACAWPADALAQLRDQDTQTFLAGSRYRATARDESVRGRPRDEFDPLGIELDEIFGAVGLISRDDVEGKTTRLASFTVFPRINSTGRWESNIFRVESAKTTDRLRVLSPGLSIVSDWENHFLEVSSSADFGWWDRTSTEDFQDLHNTVRVGLDATESLSVSAVLGLDRLHEGRGGIDDPGAGVRPLTYWQPTLNLQSTYFADAVLLNPGFTVTRLEYNPAEPLGQTLIPPNTRLRNRTDYRLASRFGYEFQPGTMAFVLPAMTQRTFEVSRDTGGFLQDSRIYSVLAGLTWDVSSVTFVDFGAGYLRQEFDEPSFQPLSAPAVLLSAIWNATELMTVTLRGETYTNETTQAGVSSVLTHRASLGLDYEMFDNLIASWSGALTMARFDEDPPQRQDLTYSTRIGVDYLIGRNFTTGAALGWEMQDSNSFSHSYANRTVEIRFGVRL